MKIKRNKIQYGGARTLASERLRIKQKMAEREAEKTPMDFLHEVYYDPKTGYGNAKSLYEKVKHLGLKMKEVEAFLALQEPQQIYKRKKRVKNYFPITAGAVGKTFQADLTFYNQFKKENKINKKEAIGLLVVINIHTRKAYAEPIFGKKTGEDTFDTEGSVMNGMSKILEQIKKVSGIKNLTTDRGSEFTSKTFQDLMEKEGIEHYFTDKNDKHMLGKAERFNRTIRNMIRKHMEAKNTAEWVSVFKDLLENYNSSYHSSIRTSPNKADAKIIKDQEMKRYVQVVRDNEDDGFLLDVGAKVRMLKPKKQFDKGTQQYYKGIYTIHQINHQSYTLKNAQGNILPHRSKFYEIEPVGQVQKHREKNEGEDRVELAKKDTARDRRMNKEGVERNEDKTTLTEAIKAKTKKKEDRIVRRKRKDIDVSNVITTRRRK